MSVPEYRAFYDRVEGNILGRFSIRRKDGVYIVEKLFARSGQAGHTRTSWRVGQSPIPYGSFTLYTASNNRGQLAGKTGIGECFPIDNQGDRYTIRNPENQRQKRTEICLHEENSFPGTMGCIAILYHADWLTVRDWLRELNAQGVQSIPLEVL